MTYTAAHKADAAGGSGGVQPAGEPIAQRMIFKVCAIVTGHDSQTKQIREPQKGKDMKHRTYRPGLCAVALGMGFLPFAVQGGDLWFTAGPVLRGGMDLKISGSSYAQTLGLNTDTGVGIGAANAYADRTYDNGYVKLAPSTGNPEAIDPNTTWNWGYNNAGQYNSEAGTLSFQRQGIPRYSALADGGSGGKDDMLGGGLRLSAGLPLKTGDKWSVDLVFGFQGIWSNGKYHENAGLVDVTDSYNVAGITPFPAAGHAGTYGGPFDPAATPPYTVIPNQPSSRTQSPSAVTPAAQSSISFDVDQSLYQFSVGPQIGFKAGKRLQFVVTPTISLNIVDVDVQRSETFVYGGATRQWSDSANETKVAFGLGATAGANLDLGKGWFIGVFGGYEWVTEKVNLAVGPNTVSVDGSGWVAGAALGKHF